MFFYPLDGQEGVKKTRCEIGLQSPVPSPAACAQNRQLLISFKVFTAFEFNHKKITTNASLKTCRDALGF